MEFIKNIFWNKQEKRLRMAWRLTLQTTFLIILLILSEALLSLASALLFREAPFTTLPGKLGSSSPLSLLAEFMVRGFLLSFSVWLAGRFIDRRPFSDFGFRINSSWWKDFWFGIGLGGALISAIFLVELAAGWIRPTGFFVTNHPGLQFPAAILIPLLIFIMVGFYEELLSRGYHLKNLAEGLSGRYIQPRTAILLACLISSAVFGIFHAANPNATLSSTLNICLAGIFLATGFLLTGELAIPIGLHISWNFFQGNVFGFPVSGADFRSATLIQIQQSGPEWLTGGAFGPEGGFLGIISNLLGILLIILWIKIRTGKVGLQTTISLPPAVKSKTSNPSSGSNTTELFQGIQHIIWDWNGTLLNDLGLCLETINDMLYERGLNSVSPSTYLDIFGFPVRDYYLKLGFDFSEEPFEEISTEFIRSYEAGRPGCTLMDGARELLQFFYTTELSQSILSASKNSYLEHAVLDYKVQDYFVLIEGLDNHHAASKLSLAEEHLDKLHIPPSSILLIGDTLHDADIADKLGLRCCLIPNGHHSKQRLEKSSATLVDSLAALRKLYISSLEKSIQIPK